MEIFGSSDPIMDSLTYSWWPYIIAVVVGIITCIKSYMAGTECPSNERIDGKTVLITGASSGLGFYTALELARRGGKIILTCRDIAKGKLAANKIKEIVEEAKVDIRILDISSLKDILHFVKEISDYNTIDILINNAGIAFHPFEKTSEGFELHFVTNYLGHFFLTNLLLPKLCNAEQGRIINISSQAHHDATINFNDMNHEKNYHARLAYGQSKLALIMMARHMAKLLEGTKTTINAVNPGIVRNTKHTANSVFGKSKIMQLLTFPLAWLLLKDLTQGIQTIVYAAVAPEVKTVSGQYLSDCQIQQPSQTAQDEEIGNSLYERSLHLIKETAILHGEELSSVLMTYNHLKQNEIS